MKENTVRIPFFLRKQKRKQPDKVFYLFSANQKELIEWNGKERTKILPSWILLVIVTSLFTSISFDYIPTTKRGKYLPDEMNVNL